MQTGASRCERTCPTTTASIVLAVFFCCIDLSQVCLFLQCKGHAGARAPDNPAIVWSEKENGALFSVTWIGVSLFDNVFWGQPDRRAAQRNQLGLTRNVYICGTVPTTGVTCQPVTVLYGGSHPSTVTSSGIQPISSLASRRAVSARVRSAASTSPSGNAT